MLNLRTYETRVGTHRALGLRAKSNSIFKTAFRTLVIGVMAVGFVPLANASLIGDDILVISKANPANDVWTDTVTVGPGIELAGNDTSQHANTNQGQSFAALFPGDFIDISANSIAFHFVSIFNLGNDYIFSTEFFDLDWTDAPGILTGVTVAGGAVGLAGFTIDRVMDHSFRFQGRVDQLVAVADFTLNLTTEHETSPPPPELIPLPAALPLYGTDLAVMGFLGWRRKRKAMQE